MRHLLSIAIALMLLAEALLPSMDACELIKVSNLFNHYQELNDNTGVFAFLASHYGEAKKAKATIRTAMMKNFRFRKGHVAIRWYLFLNRPVFPVLPLSRPSNKKLLFTSHPQPRNIMQLSFSLPKDDPGQLR